MSMKEAKYCRYSLRLIQGREPSTYFHQAIFADTWTEFDHAEIEHLPLWWLRVAALRISKKYAARGLGHDGQWEWISGWASEDERRRLALGEEGPAAAQSAPVLRPGRRYGTGLDMLLGHLWRETKVQDYDELMRLAKLCGSPIIAAVVEAWPEGGERELLRKATYRGRKKHSPTTCQYCIEGVPSEVQQALSSPKHP